MHPATSWDQLNHWERHAILDTAMALAARFPDLVCAVLTPLEDRQCLPPPETYMTRGGLARGYLPPEVPPKTTPPLSSPIDLLKAELYEAAMKTLGDTQPLKLSTVWRHLKKGRSSRQLRRELRPYTGLWMQVKHQARTDFAQKHPGTVWPF